MRERAVRLVFEHQNKYESQWAAITSVATQLGMIHETLRKWVRRAEIDGGQRLGFTTITTQRERLKELEKESKELRRANEILKAAAALFRAKLDRRPKR